MSLDIRSNDRKTSVRRIEVYQKPMWAAMLLVLVLVTACAPATSAPTTNTVGPTAVSAVASVIPAATTEATASTAASAAAPVTTAAGDAGQSADIYTDPQERFSVPIPTGWTTAQQDSFVTLSDPEDLITAYALVIENAEPAAAVAEAWRRVDPTFALTPTQVYELPVTNGVERAVSTSYDAGDDQRVIAGYAQLYQGSTYVLLIDAESAALQRRAAQVEIIESGYTILAIPTVDLRNVTPARVDAAITDELAAFTERMLEQFGVPGAAIAVVQDGEVVYINGFGVRNAETNEPLTPQTRMMIGSTGKSLTTMMMATLVDDGTIAWDTPARQIFPSFTVADPALSDQITMRNLVCACTGVPRRDLELFFNGSDLSAEDVVASLASFEFYTKIGEAFQYSNQMVASGGYIAAVADEGVSGGLFEDYAATLKARVLDPIGMPNTTLSFTEVEAGDNYAVPHGQRLAADAAYLPHPLSIEQALVPGAPAGVHWSTAEDMANYLITELNRGVAPNGTRVVSAENLQETWQPQAPVDATTQYGLGWFVGEYKGQPLIEHGGNTIGFTSDFAFLPEANLGILVLANGQSANAMNEAIRTRLFELVFAQQPEAEAIATFALEQATDQRAQLAEQISDTPDVTAITPFVGRYTNDALGDVSLTLDGDALMFDAGEFRAQLEPTRVAAGQPQAYVMTEPPFAGLTFAFENAAEQPTITMAGFGVGPYTFTKNE